MRNNESRYDLTLYDLAPGTRMVTIKDIPYCDLNTFYDIIDNDEDIEDAGFLIEKYGREYWVIIPEGVECRLVASPRPHVSWPIIEVFGIRLIFVPDYDDEVLSASGFEILD